MNQQRIEYIDIAKGIGILLVYIGHCEIGEGDFSHITHWIYSFHVPLFFFISGLLFSNKHVSAATFYRNKFASLIVPYIIFSIVNYVLLKLCHFDATLSFITNGWGTNPLWFIPILFLINAAHSHIIWGEWWLKLLVIFSMMLLMIWKANTNGWLPYSVSEIPWFYMCFLSGYMMKEIIKKVEACRYAWTWGTIGLIMLTILLFIVVVPYNANYLHTDNDVKCWIMKYSLSLIGTLSTMLISLSLSKTRKIKHLLSWLGLNSLVILCTHKLFYVILQTFNYQPFMRGGYNHLIVWGLVIGVIILYNKCCDPFIKKLHS